MLDAAGSRANIEVDGGVDESNAAALVDAGADILVAGASIFKGDPSGARGEAARRTTALRAAAMASLGKRT
jgi:pentose-5-phosphate-3-epimerase